MSTLKTEEDYINLNIVRGIRDHYGLSINLFDSSITDCVLIAFIFENEPFNLISMRCE